MVRAQERSAELPLDAPPTDEPKPFNWFAWGLTGIVLLGFAIRVFYILNWRASVPVHGDAVFYKEGAALLADGKGWINPFDYNAGHIVQSAEHPPVYILWLFLPAVIGLRTKVEVMLWSAVMGAGSIALAGFAGKEITGKRTGLIAAFFFAVYPNIFSHDGVMTSETAAIFTATLCVWTAYRYWRKPGLWRAVWLGGACALAAMSRSELVLYTPFVLLPMILATRSVDWKTRFKWLVSAGVLMVLIIGPWVGYNLARFKDPVLLGNGDGITLLSANCDLTYYGPTTGYWKQECVQSVAGKIQKEHLDQSQGEILYRDAAITYMRNHLRRLPTVVLVRWARITGVWDILDNFQQVKLDHFPEGRELWVAYSGLFMFYVLALLSIAGIVVLRKRKIPVYPLVALIALVFITITIMFGQNRYRASAEPALAILAAVAVDAAWARWRGRHQGNGGAEAEEPPVDTPPQVPEPAGV
jgi:4-amino-4-deoxy-L-arabinose transferase-like glycosyltransferase